MAIALLGAMVVWAIGVQHVRAAGNITIRVIGANTTRVHATLSATTPAEAVEDALQASGISHKIEKSGEGDQQSFFLTEIAGERDWLYQVNGWTKTYSNEYHHRIRPCRL